MKKLVVISQTRWLTENITTAFSAETYIKNSLEKLETMMGKTFALQMTPMAESAHPELDDSPFLDATDHAKFQKPSWLCKLVDYTRTHFDIAYATNSLSSV